jgi:hypothetical protein
VRPNIDIIK